MNNVSRRDLLRLSGTLAAVMVMMPRAVWPQETAKEEMALRKQFMRMTEKEWKQKLTEAQFHVLRKEGTERAWSSSLNDEKRKGIYHCAGCDNPLFSSETKFDSGTGWPSFYDHLPNAIGTKEDNRLFFIRRTEYHCARCGGHHGHVFEDGPEPTGLRYCNNGVALKFVPEAT